MLEPIASELWIAEAPLRFLGLQVGRRMTIIRLDGERLFIHSPAPLSPELRGRLDQLGQVGFVVPASALHGHLFMEQYREAYPRAELLAAPDMEARRPDLTFAAELGDRPDPRWSAEIDQAVFGGMRRWPEVLFLHRRTRSLLVGDVCWNVTSTMAAGARLWAGWRPGVRPTPAFRAVAIADKPAARASVERVLRWDFDRILIGHGQIVHSGGREAFRRAYAWLLR